jgi:hypothetical protein
MGVCTMRQNYIAKELQMCDATNFLFIFQRLAAMLAYICYFANYVIDIQLKKS